VNAGNRAEMHDDVLQRVIAYLSAVRAPA
jgi:hypothetical protein